MYTYVSVMQVSSQHIDSMEAYLQQEIQIFDDQSAAILPIGMYEAKLADPRFTFLFSKCHCGDRDCGAKPSRSSAVAFRLAPTMLQHEPGINRYTYLPHSHVADNIYTDNTAQKYIGKGGMPPCLQYDIYVRRKPQLQVCMHLLDLSTWFSSFLNGRTRTD